MPGHAASTKPSRSYSCIAGFSRVTVVGSWPNTELHITFAHAPRPEYRLRRTVPLFDELGRQAAPEYAAVHIMEALDTQDIPDAEAPGAEYLGI